MATTQQQSGSLPQQKWGFKPQSDHSSKYRFWKRGTNKTPGAIKQVRGAQYPPIMNKNQMIKYGYQKQSKQNKKRNSNTMTINSIASNNTQNYDSYLNYKSQTILNGNHFNVASQQSNNQSTSNSNSKTQSPRSVSNNNNNIQNNNTSSQSDDGTNFIVNHDHSGNVLIFDNNNNNNIHNNSNEIIENDNTLPYPDYPQSRILAKDQLRINNNINLKQDSIPVVDIDDLIKSAKNDLEIINSNFENKNEPLNTNNNANNANNANNVNNQNNININKNEIKEWDEIKCDSEAQLRKNRNRRRLLTRMVEKPMLDTNAVRRACWRGIPNEMRPTLWKLLLGYVPKNLSRRESTLKRKRNEYFNLIERYYTNIQKEHRSDQENQIVHQISLDVRRTSPELKLFQIPNISFLLSRALYMWSHRHTATGYVQGINDLITPFVFIFLDELMKCEYNISLNNMESRSIITNKLTESDLLPIEADSYWCLDYLIEGLQLNYTDGQPGIQKMVKQLNQVITRVNQPLSDHLKSEKLEFIQFSFRWMNCLLMRELSLQHIIRLWDTYLCEGVELSAGFSEFHVFVCAALLLCFADQLKEKDFAEIMLFIQALQDKTTKWTEREIETILSEAYVYQQLFGKTKKSLYN